MRRFMVLVTVVLVMTAMLVITATPIMAAATRPPVASIGGGGGVPVDPTTCTLLADGSSMFAWREGGEVCWFTPPAV